MGQHFTLDAPPAQIMGQHVLPRLYGCRRLCSRLCLSRPVPDPRRRFLPQFWPVTLELVTTTIPDLAESTGLLYFTYIYIFYSPKSRSKILKKHRKQTQVNLTNSTARITDYQKI